MTAEDLLMYRGMINARDEAMKEAHDALRSNASERERNNAKAAIENVLPELQI